MLIQFASAPCGAGKTRQIIKRACELARAGERVLVLQPTKELIERTVRDELHTQPSPPRHHVFHSDNVAGSVASAVTDHFKDAGPDGQIVFATHAVLPYVGYWADKRGWHLLIDEELQVLSHHQHQIPHTHPIITDHIELEPHDSIYSRVVACDLEELREKGRNRDEDELLGRVADLVKTLTNPHRDSFVNAEQYGKLKSGTCKRLSVHSLLKPSVVGGFGSVFIAGANFQDTAQCRLWSDMGVRFREDAEFAGGLRFRSHQNGGLVDIHYAMERPWSKRRRDGGKGDVGRDPALVRIARAAECLFGSARFVWQANKDVPDDLFPAPAAERLPNKPHGLNRYAGVNNIAFLSALNPAPDHFKFLETLGLTGADVRTAAYHAAAYQAVLRTSIREPNNQERKTVVVPDRPLAEYLRQRFPGSRVHKLDAGIIDDAEPRKPGRPRKHQSNRERMAERRARDREEKLRILNEQIALSLGHDDVGTRLCAEKGIRLISDFRTQPQPCSGTFYRGKFTGWPSAYLWASDEDSFVGFLGACNSQRVAAKDELRLISPAVFDPARPGTTRSRGLENIAYLRHLWLDFEDGDLRPEELAALFPNVRLVATNSYRHTSDRPRFRAVVLTDRPLTAEAYELLFDNVARKIEDAGYQVNRGSKKQARGQGGNGIRQSGLDWSKRTPASLFYLPSQAADPSQSFFVDFNGPGREALNPLPWIEHSVVPVVPGDEPPPWPETRRTAVNQSLVDRATSEWRAAPPHQGNDEFFRLAVRLRRAGLSPTEIEARLRAEATFGRSPRERRAQVKSIMASLRRSRRGWGSVRRDG